ncbi:MAG: hypothetical protein B6I37_00870 [Desulfobacteraceae bacterium 4572_35.2]|nr:MAG: hypothetical protein B6I37_00870 [Desulfobacteraceae bacterium 4572_35.2]
MNSARILLVIILLLTPLSAVSAPIQAAQIPAELLPWQEWVMFGQQDQTCTTVWQNNDQRRCRWPGELTLTINDAGGTFQQNWHMDREEWLLLPGNSQHWPQQVTLNGEPALVMRSDDSSYGKDRPIVQVPAGQHIIKGQFSWQKMPKNLAIDPQTALIKLTRNGSFIHQPQLDQGGLLWLNKDSENDKNTQQDQIHFLVFRHVSDTIPLQLTTRVQLEVSGKAREVRTGIVLTPDFTPLALKSPLPARLESDGTLRIQLKPGNWTIDLIARHLGPIDTLTMPDPQGPWAENEVWSIQTRSDLRVVSIDGGTAIDPNQTAMPAAWKQLPAYLMTPEQPLTLTTRKRGDSDPAPEQLHLQRTLWLDFDGKGYTVKDTISGQLTNSSRLEANTALELGRVSINDQDQFITRLEPQAPAGIELRQGAVVLEAESRINPQNINALPAVGWQLDVGSLQTVLNLPPGWRLLEASGPDNASTTWLRSWSLLDIFIVLVLALSFWRLWGALAGLGALIGMVLIYHEPNAPQLVWLNVLIPIALLRVLPHGRAKQLTQWYRNAGLLLLLVLGLTFSVQQIRSALYPQLETNSSYSSGYGAGFAVTALPVQSKKMMPSRIMSMADGEMTAQGREPKRLIVQYDPNIKVQTGPGIPQWQWRQIQLSWNGPVTADQQLKLYLLPPLATRLLLLSGVLLMALLFLRLLTAGPLPRWKRSVTKPSATALVLIALATALFSLPTTQAHAAFPSPELLEELQLRLMEPASCNPNCTALNKLEISADQQHLHLRMTFHSQTTSAVPLPLPNKQLTLQSARLDQSDQAALYRDKQGDLWARIPQGEHDLEIYASIPEALQRIQLPLPMAAGVVSITAANWQITGIKDGEASHGPIELTRQTTRNDNQLQAGVIPPFVEVRRQLHLGHNWQIKTTVRRLSQLGSAALVKIPLLQNEQITSSTVQVIDHQALVSLAPNARTFSWNSRLDKTSQLELLAQNNDQFTEVWQLIADPIWHVKSSGLPVIHHYQNGRWQPEWRPWGNEKLTLDISRPTGIQGQTVTIDNSHLEITPGNRTTQVKLTLNLRTSQGSDHVITLPVQARLGQVTLNGQPQPIKQQNLLVTIPLPPGKHQLELSWQQDQGVDLITRTPQIHLGGANVNSTISLMLPQDRWTLFTGGPILGPAVLFWGVLLVVTALAFILGRMRFTPLRWWHWLLLFAGLSQASLPALIPVAAWLLLLGLRKKHVAQLNSAWRFNFSQMLLIALSFITMITIIGAIQQGLLGLPEMQIVGNRSSAWSLNWFQDRSNGFLAEAWALSVPMYIYRLSMLFWALWLALALLKWVQWGWTCFSTQGLWRKLPPRLPRKKVVKRDKGATDRPQPPPQ